MGPRLSSLDGLRRMFPGWSSFSSHFDAAKREHVVVLSISEKELQAAIGPMGRPDALVDRLLPKKVTKARAGVRFHGRVVGRRA